MTFSGKRTTAIAAGTFLALTAVAVSATGPESRVFATPPRHIQPAISQGYKPAISPQGYDCSTTTSPPFYCFGAENDSAVNGFTHGVYGMEGYAPNAIGGVGVLGYEGNSSESGGYGVYGVSFATNGTGVYGAADGPAPAASATPNGATENTGVVGNSHSGDGVYGSTEWPNPSNGLQIGGVVGVDATSNDDNNGVLGLSASGTGVTGFSSTGTGVFAESDGTSSGVVAASDSGSGVTGFALGAGNGVTALNFVGFLGSPTPPPNVEDQTGVTAESGTGAGLFAYSGNDPPIVAEKGCNTYTEDATEEGANCSGIFLQDDGTSGYEIEVYNSSAADYPLYSNSSGDLFLAGNVFDAGGTFSRTRNPGTDEMTTAPRETEATVEDFGSAQLVNGTAAVALRPDFKSAINREAAYMVFLTPYGDNRGLFVASRTPDGFVVRETQAGHSTLAFDYRVVARPYGEQVARLPSEAVLNPHRPRLPASASARAASARREFAAQFSRFGHMLRSKPASFETFVPRPNLTLEGRIR